MEQQASTVTYKMEIENISTSVSATHEQGEQTQSSTVIVASQQETDDDYIKTAGFSIEDSTTL